MNNITEIRDTAYGGYGVGQMEDGRVVFIPHTVTGDKVRFSVTEDKSRFVYGTCEEVIEPSKMRGEIYCPHIGSCGGCVFGHINYADQLDIKLGFVKTAFSRNKLDIPEPEMISADFREFRNRATFRIRSGKAGFYKFKSNDFIPVEECPVIKKSIVEKAVQFAASAEMDCSLYITENEDEEALGSTQEGCGDFSVFKGLKCGSEIKGAKTIPFKTKYGTFYAGFSTFLQGNRHLSGKLQDFVADNASGKNALELYSGVGFLTLPLSDACERVDAVESYSPSVRLAEKAGMRNVSFFTGASERVLLNLRKRYDTIVTDPPRNGMEKNVCRFIDSSNAENLIYISCDPNTMARDIARLKTYEISHVAVCDMFPESYHVETLALLNKV